jgi:hypothetical protein
MTIKAALVALCIGASAAHADIVPDRFSLLLGSHHVDPQLAFNEDNPGLFLTWGRVTAGAYVNSFDRGSVAVTYALPLASGRDWSIDVFAGAAWYPVDGRAFAVHVGDVVPIGGLQGRWRGLFVQVMPSDGKATDAIVTFGMTFQTRKP